MALSCHVSALTLLGKGKEITLSPSELIAQVNYTHQMYGPFRRENTLFEGYQLSEFLSQHFGEPIGSVRLTAIDGYQLTLNDIDQRRLMLVVKENGQPLSIRNHGPLRLIETDLGGRDPRNISLFDDWIWMIDQIEALNE